MTRTTVLIVTLILAAAGVIVPASSEFPESAVAGEAFRTWLDDLRAVEAVYWSHRIWPDNNPGPKPSLFEVMSREGTEARARRTLAILRLLDQRWQTRIDAGRLQIELNRVAVNTRDPEMLGELFAALDHDAERIARALVLPGLVERLARRLVLSDDALQSGVRESAEDDLRLFGGRPLAALSTGRLVEIIHESPDPIPGEKERMLREERTFFVAEENAAPVNGKSLTVARAWDKLDIDDVLASFDPVAAAQQSPMAGLLLHDLAALSLPEIPEPSAMGAGCTDDTWSNYTVEPSRRELHRAVWTGAEMIVWGGSDDAELFDSGGIYTPATDSWRPTSLVGAPEPRSEHSAVWTGTEMIVWGGDTQTGTFQADSGARYDPVTDGWTPTSQTNAPGERSGHVAVWTGSEMIIWGGYAYNGNGAGPGRRYDPSTDSWSTLSALPGPEPRPNATAVWTGTDMLIFGGGFEDAEVPFEIYGDTWRYRPSTQTWSIRSPFPGGARTQHTAVWTGSEMIVWGGYGLEYDAEGDEYFSVQYNDGWRYDPGTNSWSAVGSNGPVPLERYKHSSVWTGSEMVIYGGYNGYDSAAYDPSVNSWRFVPTGTSPAYQLTDHSTVWTGDEMIVWGGFGNTGTSSDGGRWDPISNTWTPTFSSGAPPPRAEHTAVWTGSEMILHGGNAIDWQVTYRYDPALNAWSTAAPAGLTSAVDLHTAVWTGTEMIVWGGFAGGVLDDGGRYNPTTDSWSPASQVNGPTPRLRHTAQWTGTEMIVWGGDVVDPSGGRYDPVTDSWAPMTQINAPQRRNHHASVVTADSFLVWGGNNAGTLNDGGRYDWATDTWTPITTVGAPGPRQRFTAVWSGSEMIVWGGNATTSNTPGLNTGGRYDPDTDSWAATATVSAPAGRGRHVAVWSGGEMIVWGGRASLFYESGGRYDPTADSWTPTSTDRAPAGRYNHSGTWNGAEMMIFGGQVFNRTPIGGRYCGATACAPVDWYGDADGDGFGDSGDVVSACDAPVGYVSVAEDCDDTNPDAWATPSEPLNLIFGHDKNSSTTTLSWDAPAEPGAPTLTYDLLRSSSPSDFGVAVCLESGDSDLVAIDTETPGTVQYYLPRASNGCTAGVGSLGFDSQGTPRTGASCP